jgi:hypothetical protein
MVGYEPRSSTDREQCPTEDGMVKNVLRNVVLPTRHARGA